MPLGQPAQRRWPLLIIRYWVIAWKTATLLRRVDTCVQTFACLDIIRLGAGFPGLVGRNEVEIKLDMVRNYGQGIPEKYRLI